MSEKQLQAERHISIRGIIENELSIKVEDLSDRFGVSKNTIRRDLNLLEEQGYLIRSQGGAVLQNSMFNRSYDEKQSLIRKGKKRIAQRAAELIGDGETIILGTGTGIIELAGYLKKRDHLTIITNSLDIAQILSNDTKVTLILCGGIFDPHSRSMVGMPAEIFFRDIHVDKLFLAVKAIDKEAFYDINMIETPVKRAMIKIAEKTIIMTEYSKFGKTSLSRIDEIAYVDSIICDMFPPDQLRSHYEAAGIEIITSSEE